MSLDQRLDHFQRRHHWAGLPLAVIYKFVDDQGSYLAALMTYYGFLSLFPLLLLAVTILGFVLHGNPHLQHQVLDSALKNFPIVGKQIETDVHGYSGSAVALVVGILVSLYGALGIAQASQNVMNVVWGVPRNARPNPIRARVRSLGILAVLGTGFLVTTVLSGFATGAQSYAHSLHVAAAGRLLATVVAVLLNVLLFVTAFRVLTVADIGARDVLWGAVVAAVAWQVLQTVGTYFVAHELKGSREVYGVFGVVLGLLAWTYIQCTIFVLCAELNVVLRKRLWPRALLTPFTDNVDLTGGDRRAYGSYARSQRFKGFEKIDVDFGEQGEAPQAPSETRGGAVADPAPSPTDAPPPGQAPTDHER